MTTVDEASIRDKLSQCLEILEPGLSLVQTEYPLANPFGTKGFIDILARDAYGNHAIIELKRSKQASRQAIHEIFKYVALYREESQLPEHKIRCLIVSTEWEELRVPFSELRRSSTFQVEGHHLTVDVEGAPVRSIRVQPVALREGLHLYRDHSVFLFVSREKRDQAVQPIVEAFRKAGGTGCFIVVADYGGINEAVVYRFSAYLVTASVSAIVRTQLEREYDEEYGADGFSEEERELGLQESFAERILSQGALEWDDFEIGYPEKFLTNEANGWKAIAIVREGAVPPQGIIDDIEVRRLVSGVEGTNYTNFSRLTSPRHHLDWADTLQKMRTCLRGNPTWLRACECIAREVETRLTGASVAFCIYNPLNSAISLFELVARKRPEYCPSLEIFIHDAESGHNRAIFGTLEWDGCTAVQGVADVLCVESVESDAFLSSRPCMPLGSVTKRYLDGKDSLTELWNGTAHAIARSMLSGTIMAA